MSPVCLKLLINNDTAVIDAAIGLCKNTVCHLRESE